MIQHQKTNRAGANITKISSLIDLESYQATPSDHLVEMKMSILSTTYLNSCATTNSISAILKAKKKASISAYKQTKKQTLALNKQMRFIISKRNKGKKSFSLFNRLVQYEKNWESRSWTRLHNMVFLVSDQDLGGGWIRNGVSSLF